MGQRRDIFEASRLIGVWLVNVQPHIKKKIRRPQDLVQFAWDDKGYSTKPTKQQSLEEMKEVMYKIAGKKYTKKRE